MTAPSIATVPYVSETDDIQPGRRGVTRQKILEAAYALFTAHGGVG